MSPVRRYRWVAGVAAASVLTISSCSSAEEPEAPSAPVVTKATTPAAAPAKSTAATSHRLGSKVDVAGVTVQVREFRPRVRLDVSPDGPGNHWAAARIRTCWTGEVAGVTGDVLSVSWLPWSLVDSQDGRWSSFESGTVPDNWLQPVYPEGDELLRKGECVTGWVQFPVDDGVKVTEIRYAGDGTASVSWKV